ncbi:MAG: hypothetical protein HYT15_00200, partial [Candidatus Magasanikbacteria bacterium]|nr:hypothetical protein [Candidatus Magasanikbacteria bacterium]
YAIADVVEQNGPTRFNMLAKGAGGFYDFSHWNVERQSDGFFTDEFFVEWYITPGFPPAVFIINATGSVFSESLNFVNHWLVGWNDTGGIWHTECELSINNDGPRRYHNWDRVSRSGIDGQWRVWHEVVEDSIAAILPEPYYQSIDTIAQNQDGSLFDLKGTRAGLLANLPRASNGRVEETIPASGTVYRITGWITNDHLDLTVTWDWYNQTGELIWHVKDRYRGTPRFQPHVKKSPSLPLGAFNAEIVQTANTFDGLLEAPHRYVIDVLPADNGQIVLWIGGIKTQPSNLIANADGSFSFRFVRSSGGYYYDYSLNDLVITGDKISFLMQVNAIPSGSTEVLYIFDYTASGDKRFRHFFSTAP